ncbi:MAG: hypothetical protein DI632_00010 [Sphingomonas hengshuiensis]|uniref:Uncharacterized protein n=1 Tax=Sphingomonas hengshuiensis TaxID=1609977 RepID=A0A2W5BDF1_9SPHN|nr:MAG: hypothetical protein DI632_00010 [Sphingomonas hengshuiensis]
MSLSLSFTDAITVLMDACGLSSEARSAFDARVRHLQRLGVPYRRDDAAARLHYGISELAAFATAVRLMDAFMAPALAARYVTEGWSALAPFLMAGAADALPQSYTVRRSIPGASIAVFRANALAMLGKRRQHDDRSDEPLGDVLICSEARTARVAEAVDGAALVLDSRTYLPAIVRGWAERLSATENELAHELDRLLFYGQAS